MKTHKEKIDNLISLEKENTLINHLVTSLLNKGETIAEKKPNEYIIWTSNNCTSIFYPTFKIEFSNNGNLSKIKSELNSQGKLLGIIILGFISYFFISQLIIPIFENYENLNFTDFLIIIPFLLLIYGFFWVFKRIYKNETKYLLNELKIHLGLETNKTLEIKENEKNEWTLNRTLVRILMYPFAICLIIFSVYSLKEGRIFKGLFGISIVSAYLYSDIKILLNKNKTKANNS